MLVYMNSNLSISLDIDRDDRHVPMHPGHAHAMDQESVMWHAILIMLLMYVCIYMRICIAVAIIYIASSTTCTCT